MSVHEKMTAIANRIRQFGGGDGGNLLNLDQIADGVEQVYDNGYYVGDKHGKAEILSALDDVDALLGGD